jgi:hypothetical protein
MGMRGERHALLLYSLEREPVPIAKESESAPGPVWTREENHALLGFDPRTVQPVASSHTDYAIPAHLVRLRGLFKFENVCNVSRGKPVSDVKCMFQPVCSSRTKYFAGGRV